MGRVWPSPKWTAGRYPQRHRALLGEKVDTGCEGYTSQGAGEPLLDWPDQYAEKHATAYKALLEGDCAVLVIGPRGTGKTQLAVEYSVMLERDLCEVGEDWAGRPENKTRLTHAYYRLGDLFEKQKASFDDKSEGPLKRAANVDLLVLDELQEVTGSNWEMQQLTRLIDQRYLTMKRTVMVANLAFASAKEFLGDSAWSRLSETGVVLEWDGPTMR